MSEITAICITLSVGVVIVGLIAVFVPRVIKEPGCLCDVGRFSTHINYDCPIHGDHIEPLYPIGEIIAARTKPLTERDQACREAGLHVNKLLSEKWGNKWLPLDEENEKLK